MGLQRHAHLTLTQRQHAEQALRRCRRRLRYAMEGIAGAAQGSFSLPGAFGEPL